MPQEFELVCPSGLGDSENLYEAKIYQEALSNVASGCAAFSMLLIGFMGEDISY